MKMTIGVIVSLMLLCLPAMGETQSTSDVIEIPRYPIDLEGVIQDINNNIVSGVTLHVWTEYPIDPWSGKMEEKYYCLKVDSPFHLQLTPGTSSMKIAAEKEGYRGTSGYHFDDEELSAKDVVIRLLPYVRESDLDTNIVWPKITKEGESIAYSFKRGCEISLKWKPDPNDIYVYLEVTGEPTSFSDITTYSVALIGVGIEFCEGFPFPPLKYAGSGGIGDLLQAPETGYASRIEVDNPKDLADRCFYFKTREGKYGKFVIPGQGIDLTDCLLVSLKYYYQPDSTRDIVTKRRFVSPDTTPPTTTDNYQYNGVWTNQSANITLTATDDISGVAHTYYTINNAPQQEGTNIVVTAEGQRTISYWSVDALGNTESPRTIGVWIDKTPPVSTATVNLAPNTAGWNNTLPVKVGFSGTDNLSGVISITSDVEITTEGIYPVSYQATDYAGNVEAEKTITVSIDTTPPDVTISAEPSILWPPNNKPVRVTISGSAVDNLSGVDTKVFTTTDEYTPGQYSGNNNITANLTDFGQKIELMAEREGNDKDGRIYTVKIVVADKAGNSANKETTVTVPHDMGDKKK